MKTFVDYKPTLNTEKLIYLLVLACLTFLPTINNVNAQALPTKDKIVEKMALVNDYWLSVNGNPGNNKWARAAYFTGCMDFYKIYPDQRYWNYMIYWADLNKWGLYDRPGNTRHADDQCAGQVYYDLYNLDSIKIESRLTAIKNNVSAMVNSIEKDDWWWVDALYMAMPIFTRLGKHLNNTAYYQKMYDLYDDTKSARTLYNVTEYLWYRDGNYIPPATTPGGEDIYWARGNGWVIAAHVRTLQMLPQSDPHHAEYLLTFKNMAIALKDRQRSDGFWNPSLDDPSHFGGPETSGTSFFTYSLAWGINNGHLDSATYYPVIVKAWNGLIDKAVHTDGFLGYVQGVGKDPSSSQPVSSETTADFGVGAFLLAGTEVCKLASGTIPEPKPLTIGNITASGFQSGTDNTPQAAFDSNLTTRWSADGPGQWIMYNFNALKVIKSVDIAFYKGNERKAKFKISVSTDGTNFTDVFDGESSGGSAALENFDFADLDGQFVRITGFGNSVNDWNSISEIQIKFDDKAVDPNSVHKVKYAALTMYPNPVETNSSLVIITGFEGECLIKVFDISGRLVLNDIKQANSEGIVLLNRLNLPQGSYVINIGNKTEVKSDMLYVR